MARALLYKAKDKVFLEKTGKGFDEWKKLLDKWKAYKKGNTKITEHLKKKYKLKDDWAKAIAIRYEMERFLKK